MIVEFDIFDLLIQLTAHPENQIQQITGDYENKKMPEPDLMWEIEAEIGLDPAMPAN